VKKHNIAINLPEDTHVIEPPNPTRRDKEKKTPALLSLGIVINDNPNILMLTAAYHELGSFLMD
jgi:hypothetical protein